VYRHIRVVRGEGMRWHMVHETASEATAAAAKPRGKKRNRSEAGLDELGDEECEYADDDQQQQQEEGKDGEGDYDDSKEDVSDDGAGAPSSDSDSDYIP
jgi:hypothetical protein